MCLLWLYVCLYSELFLIILSIVMITITCKCYLKSWWRLHHSLYQSGFKNADEVTKFWGIESYIVIIVHSGIGCHQMTWWKIIKFEVIFMESIFNIITKLNIRSLYPLTRTSHKVGSSFQTLFKHIMILDGTYLWSSNLCKINLNWNLHNLISLEMMYCMTFAFVFIICHQVIWWWPMP